MQGAHKNAFFLIFNQMLKKTLFHIFFGFYWKYFFNKLMNGKIKFYSKNKKIFYFSILGNISKILILTTIWNDSLA